MAEYKYRALGWQDDDIASLNVVDGATADNQVELQITKQGAGTIDGPAIIGKDGITINKAADSEKIEISGSGLVQHCDKKGYTRAYVVDYTGWDTTMIIRSAGDNSENTLMQRKADGSGEIVMPETPVDLSITNKKYVDDNYVKKDTSVAAQQVYGHISTGEPQMFYVTTGNSNPNWLCMYQTAASGATKPSGSGRLITQDPTQPYQAANKHYVDDADKDQRLKLSNLEQSLNGYILDTTEEAYADLDSAVLKDSVAVGDNVYPIADKTRALVTRIEGKTAKMVQLLDKSKYYNKQTKSGITATNNGDGSWTINGTATASDYINFSPALSLNDGHKVLLTGNKTDSGFMLELLNQWISDTGNGAIGNIKAGFLRTWGVSWKNGAVINNVTITPQLFDLTAMNREDITSAEQFKAEFPDLYPYENGNIYPAKISGVKFTGKNLKNIPNGIGSKDYAANELPKNIPLVLSARLSLKEGNARVRASWIKNGTREYAYGNTITASTGISKAVFTIPSSATDTRITLQTFGDDVGFEYSNVQIEAGPAATAYEPYTEPVFVTLPDTYDLNGIGDYKDYLEITKNEDNELYTLKKVQVIDKHIFDGTEYWNSYGSSDFTNLAYRTAGLGSKFINWQSRASLMNLFNRIYISTDAKGYAHGDSSADLFIRLPNIATAADMKAHVLSMYEAGTPYIFYGAIATPVETVIATNLTYEQVTAIRHNGGLIEVEGNTNKGYARPTVTNTIVYRLTASTTSDSKLDKQTAQTESDQVYGKLADGSQTMFDVTMGATATTIPRRDTAGRIQVADGVSGNDAVNFNQLSAQKEALEAELNKKQATLVSGTNIKTINGNSLLGSGDLVIESGGTEVTPNPTLSGSEAALSALQIGDTKYRIEGSLTTLMVGIDSSLLGG